MHHLLMVPCKTNKWQMREQAVKTTAKIFHASYFSMAFKQQTRIYENSEGRKENTQSDISPFHFILY